jgi:serine/threonine protein kinase/tetratricopeptide (TPR) repeat protein
MGREIASLNRWRMGTWEMAGSRGSTTSEMDIFQRINELSRRFRKEVAKGQSPSIESYLEKVPAAAQGNLLGSLLEIEINHRRQRGETLNSENYLTRFKHHSQLIRDIFYESSVLWEGSTSQDPRTNTVNQPDPFLPPTVELPPSKRLGPYELQTIIGRGAFGVVYKARHAQNGHLVALKILPSTSYLNQVEPQHLHRFRNEFRRICRIDHQNLVGLQNLSVDDQQWYFTMDLIDGEDFKTYVRPNGELHESRLRNCLKQLASGIFKLHEEGLVHRDLKPKNVMVNREGVVKILDFGLAAHLQQGVGQSVSKSLGFAGTEVYAAPEQMFSERNESTDWYAFGTMIYEALKGETPFKGQNQGEVIYRKQKVDPPPLVGHPDFPRGLDDLAELADGLIVRNPEKRTSPAEVSELFGLGGSSLTWRSGTQSHGSSLTFSEWDEVAQSHGVDRLIGRHAQMEQLGKIQRAFKSQRQPTVTWVVGLSGEGKSTLVGSFLEPFRSDNRYLVLSGRCYEQESIPFKAVDCIVDSLISFLLKQSDEQVKKWLPDDMESLLALFPLLGRVAPIAELGEAEGGMSEQRANQNRAFVAFRQLLGNIGADRSIIVWIDDLQWADRDSAIAWLRVLGGEDPPPVMLLGCSRADEFDASPFLQTWKLSTEDEDHDLTPEKVEVRHFTLEESIDFLVNRTRLERSTIEPQAKVIYEDTQGNPFFLELLLGEFNPETQVFKPRPIQAIIDQRVGQLSVEARQILETIAIAGKEIALREVIEVAGCEEQSSGDIIHQLRRRHLVRTTDNAGLSQLDTHHDKIRESIIAMMPDANRRRIHRLFGSCLAEKIQLDPRGSKPANSLQVDDRVFDAARHLTEAGDSRAFAYQLQAARISIAAYGMENGLDHLHASLKVKPTGLDPEVEYEIHNLLGRANDGCHNIDTSLTHYEKALELASTASERAECQLALCDLHWKRSEYDLAMPLLRSGLRELGERYPKSTGGKLFASLVELIAYFVFPSFSPRRLRKHRPEDLQTLSRFYIKANQMVSQLDTSIVTFVTIRGLRVAKMIDDPIVRAEALAGYAFLLAISGFSKTAVKPMRQAEEAERQAKEQRPRGVVDYYRSVYLYCCGDYSRAKIETEMATRRLSNLGDYRASLGHHFRWHVASHTGETRDLCTFAVKEFEICAERQNAIFMSYGLYGLAEGLARRGKLQDASVAISKCLGFLEPLNAPFLPVALNQKTRVDLQAGEYASARRAAWRSTIRMLHFKMFEITAPALPLLTEAILGNAWVPRLEKLKGSDRLKARFFARASRWIGWLYPTLKAHGLRVSGRAAAVRGRKKWAVRYFTMAIAQAEKLGANYELARALIDRSWFLSETADTDRARGLAILEELECVLPLGDQRALGIDMPLPPDLDIPREMLCPDAVDTQYDSTATKRSIRRVDPESPLREHRSSDSAAPETCKSALRD